MATLAHKIERLVLGMGGRLPTRRRQHHGPDPWARAMARELWFGYAGLKPAYPTDDEGGPRLVRGDCPIRSIYDLWPIVIDIDKGWI